MVSIGDIHIYVTDFELALRFWADGLGLEVAEREISRASGWARLDFSDGGSIRLLGPVDPWEPGARPPLGTRPTIRFDLTTTDFDLALSRALEHGGSREGEVETYNGLRVVTIADPDGNTFELIELPPEHEDSA
ncbi:MAG: VOC family protein [Phycisphaerae bacterium]|nr:VOC family protein [Phycisphaerae bacterium]MCZ2401285.1 VOC family protein [Phycisphaerae bacterium]